MNRRGFLKLMGAGTAVSVGGIALIDTHKTFFLPPSGGWAQPSLAEAWLDYVDQVRPAGVLVTAETYPFIRYPAIYEDFRAGHVRLLVPEETDSELRARMLAAFSKTPRMSWPTTTIADLKPWESA